MGGGVVESQLVEVFGRHARLHFGNEQVQHFGGQSPRSAHPYEVARVVQGHRKMGATGGFKHIRIGHDGHGNRLFSGERLM